MYSFPTAHRSGMYLVRRLRCCRKVNLVSWFASAVLLLCTCWSMRATPPSMAILSDGTPTTALTSCQRLVGVTIPHAMRGPLGRSFTLALLVVFYFVLFSWFGSTPLEMRWPCWQPTELVSDDNIRFIMSYIRRRWWDDSCHLPCRSFVHTGIAFFFFPLLFVFPHQALRAEADTQAGRARKLEARLKMRLGGYAKVIYMP